LPVMQAQTMTGFSTDSLTVSTADGLNFVLVEPFSFTRADGTIITVPAGTTSDGASTPRILWPTLPPGGKYWRAAFLHDYLYRDTGWPKVFCDNTFLEAMEDSGVNEVEAHTLYETVSHLGAISYLEDRKGELSMWAKIKAFFGGFFGNVKADPVSTGKGLVSLAGAAGIGYLAATGAIPIPVAVSVAGPMAASGIHALGTNTLTGGETPTAIKTEAAIQTVQALAPTVLSAVDQITAVNKEAADASQKKVDLFLAITAALASTVPPVVPPAVTVPPVEPVVE
jgi:hypothetical protein